MNISRCAAYLVASIAVFSSFSCNAEDIELYVRNIADRVGTAPQVMIIFDNSGSMRNSESVRSNYDPTATYAGHYTNGANDRAVFFTVGAAGVAELPDPIDDTRRFNEAINACNQSLIPLYGLWRNIHNGTEINGYELEQQGLNYADYTLIDGGQGYYVDRVAEYYSSGQNKNTWRSLRENNGMNATDVMDCLKDILEIDQNNPGEFGAQNGNGTPISAGLPVNGMVTGNGNNKVVHTHYFVSDPNNIENDSTYQSAKATFADVNVVTLYTGNYLNWKTATDEEVGTTNRSRLDIAKEAITSVVNATSTVDFGLTLFNINYPYEGNNDGGRVVSKITTRSSAETQALLDTVNNIRAQTNTPLCETMYEVYRYFASLSVRYGNENGSYRPYWLDHSDVYIEPGKDTSAESGGYYISPYGNNCRNEAYVVLITDGYPTVDTDANSTVASLPGAITTSKVDGNYLPVLTEWMYNHDVNTSLDGVQNVVSYTIGFGSDAVSAEPILQAAAQKGGGDYYAATDPDELASALQRALISILEQSASFTSPSVASNNFDRTRSLDNVYYSMFFPEDGPRWPGNLKKLVVTDNVIVDSNGLPAIDSNGNIANTAFTFWGATSDCESGSVCADGNDVNRGGVAEYLASKSPADRTIYSNIGPGGALQYFTAANASSGVGNLANVLAVNNGEEAELINWARGQDVHDENNNGDSAEMRVDVFGDPLHSKPLVINYGGSAENQDLRVVVGTNAGFLHMFDDNDSNLTESWSFIPTSLYSNLDPLRDNTTNGAKVYGMDGSPVAYVKDSDGTINAADGDKVWLFAGMRRGGNQYFAFDVTSPDSPSLKWTITGGSNDFPTLGQTWSQPIVGFIKSSLIDVATPVIIFGAGYVNDSDSTGASNEGRGIYIVNANTGARIWSFTPDANLSNNTQVNIQDAIPAKVAALDSDFDGYIDRIYAGDLGGNIWRMDLFGSDATKWTAYQLADLSGIDAADKRKFFNEPTIVRTFINVKKRVSIQGNEESTVVVSKEVPYEGIVIGSGDRAHPNSSTVNDKLYVIQDRNIITDSFTTAPSWSGITEDDLFDMSGDPIQQAIANNSLESMLVDGLSTKKGWYIDLPRTGEKSLSAARVIGGVAYFTSYTPPDSGVLANSCTIKAGTGRLYAMDLSYGTQIYDWGTEMVVGNRIPDTPVTFAGENDSGKSLLSFIGVGQGENNTGVIEAKGSTGEPGQSCADSNSCDVDFGLKTYKLHTKVEEK
ncbi:pilus assembly protein [Catenovulum agarivorans]|uniref:pilus assembly protein n=1 Tax=Catenovulum agarivorans TaxID=1172192 RepID=UPI0002D5953F|nr:PilC/PilY family type IV pilus protein [Catenovulum agarivorans]